MAAEKFNLLLQKIIKLSPTVSHFVFKREDGNKLKFIPGQFITLHINTKDKNIRRNYSIANLTENTEEIEIACSYVKDGIASELLFNASFGQIFAASGPYGRFILPDDYNNINRFLLIATGTGVTPYRTMLNKISELLNNQEIQKIKIILILGVRSKEYLLYGNDFLEFSRQNDNFEFVACYSRELPPQPGGYEHAGYVQDYLINLKINQDQDVVYLCGNPNMIDIVFSILSDNGLDSKRIKREKYISAK